MKKVILVFLVAVFAVISCNKEKAAEAKNAETSENKEKKEIIQPAKEEKEMTIYDFTVKDRKETMSKCPITRAKCFLS